MRELLDDTMGRLLSDLVTPEGIRQAEAGVWPEELFRAIEASGFLVATAPESLGGAGASWDDVYGLVRLAGRHNLPLPLPETLLANWLLGRCGLEARNEALGIASKAELQEQDGRWRGMLSDVPWGRQVRHVLTVVGGTRPRLVLLPRADAQVVSKLNTAGEPRDDLLFSGVAAIASADLAPGLPADVLHWGGAMLRCAQMAGALEKALELSTAYATERVQFGKPISAFQAIQHQLAQMAQHTGAAVVSAETAFVESGEGLAHWHIATARICGIEAAGSVAAMAHAVHGAIGFTHEHALQQGTRRLWAWRSEYGNLSHWAQRLGAAVCRQGAATMWPAVTQGSLDALETGTYP